VLGWVSSSSSSSSSSWSFDVVPLPLLVWLPGFDQD
jgi:hypothetical protein